jgi:RNA polymerase sigma-70 factor, ECF subfamily
VTQPVAKKPVTDTFQTALIAAIPNLRAFAISLCGNVQTANDLVQETMLKAWANRQRFEEGSNFKAWLFTILRNTYFSDFRRGKREVRDEDGVAAATLTSLPEQPGHMDMIDFQRALAKLSEDQKEALILVGAEGFSYEETAEICNCAVGTIKSRVNRARARLVELMGVGSVDDFGPERVSQAVFTKASM